MKSFITINFFVFVLISLFSFLIARQFPLMSLMLLMGTNILMCLLNLLSWFIVNKQIHERPQAFVRGVYSATFLKLLICMGSFLTYALMNRTNLYKPSIFVLFGIYIIYTITETSLLSKMARKK